MTGHVAAVESGGSKLRERNSDVDDSVTQCFQTIGDDGIDMSYPA